MVLWLNVWNKELLTLRKFFVVLWFLKAKFDCIMNSPLFLLKHILLSIAWNWIVVGSIIWTNTMCQGDMYSLFDLFSNKFCIINSETHNISKRKHLLHFTTKVLLIKVLRWAILILHNLRFVPVVQFRVHDFLCNVSNYFESH